MGHDRGGDPAPHLIRALLLALALALAVAVGLGVYADFGDLAEALDRFRWSLFPLALALVLVNYVLRFWRWQLYLDRLGISVPLGRSFSIFFAGLSMTISPGKLGEVLKSGLLRRSFGVPVSRSAPIVLVERISDALGVVALAVLGGAGAAGSWELLVVAAIACVVVVAVLRSSVLDRFRRLAGARAAAAELLGLRLVVVTTALSAVSWFFECLAAYVCVRGLGLDLSLADTVVVFCVASLAGALTFLPGGLGVADGGMAALLRTLGEVARADAAAATVVIRLATLWFAVGVGVVALAAEQRLARRGGVYPVPAEPEPPGRRSSMR